MAVVARLRSIAASKFREQVTLLGDKNGVNRTYTLPPGEKAVHNPANGLRVKVYFDTRRLQDSEYVVEESGGVGTGFDQITTTAFAPRSNSSLFADYIAI